MTNKIKIAIVGMGYWGPNLLRNFYQLDNVCVSAVCDQDQKRLDWVKKNYPVFKTTKNFKDILKDIEITALVLALPTSLHYKFAKAGLSAGKDVLVEKPFTSNTREAKELTSLAEQNKKILMVDHTFIYSPAVRKIKELIEKGELGKINYFDSERINLGLVRSDVNVIWDLAVHDLSIIDYLFFQKPEWVLATGSHHVLNKKEEMAHIILKHEAGLISHIHVSWLSPLKIRKILIGGNKKMVLYDDVEPSEKIRIYDCGIDLVKTEVTPFQPLYRSGDVNIPKIDQTETLKLMAEHFIDCLKNRKKPHSDGQAGLRVMEAFEAIQKSLSGGGKFIKI